MPVSTRFACRIAPLLLVFAQSAFAGADACKDILVDGTRALSLYHTRDEYRRLLDTTLINMTYSQAKSDTSLTGTIPIGDIVLGVGFSENSFNSYKSYLQTQTSVRIDASHAVDVMLATGDQTIASAWSTCMAAKPPGFSMYFSELQATSAVLTMEWKASPGVPEVSISQDYKLPKGVTIVSGKDLMTGKVKVLAGAVHKVQFEFDSPTTTLQLTLNTKDGQKPTGGDTAYVDSRLESFVQTKRHDFATDKCSQTDALAVDAPRHSGTSTVGTYCTDATSGWRFSQSTLQVFPRVALPGQVEGSFANHQDFWSGFDQLTVILGCSNSSSTDVQCQSNANVQEERIVWKPKGAGAQPLLKFTLMHQPPV